MQAVSAAAAAAVYGFKWTWTWTGHRRGGLRLHRMMDSSAVHPGAHRRSKHLACACDRAVIREGENGWIVVPSGGLVNCRGTSQVWS